MVVEFGKRMRPALVESKEFRVRRQHSAQESKRRKVLPHSEGSKRVEQAEAQG